MVVIAIAVVVVLFIVGMIVNYSRDKAATQTAEQNQNADTQQNFEELTSASSTETASTSASSTIKVTKPKPTVTSKTSVGAEGAITQSYADALKIYSASGYRIQIVNCVSTPNSLTLKKGVKFMIDNRDSTTHKIKVDTTTYTVKGYGFVIAVAGKVGSTNLYCDGRNAAKIVIEK